MSTTQKYLLILWVLISSILFSSSILLGQDSLSNKPKGIDIMITQSPKIVVKLEGVTHNTCFGDEMGAINISAIGGYPPYQYYWSNSDTTQDIAALRAGEYKVAVYDRFSCSDTLSVTIDQPDELIGEVESVKDILCYGYNNGEIEISVKGGTPPYLYSWSDGSTAQDLKGVNSGSYSVLVTDANFCQEIVSAEINEKPLIVRFIDDVEDIKCNGEETGSIDITVAGGVPPYSYVWSNEATTQDIEGLPSGVYQVSVSDSGGCTEVSSTKIQEPDPLEISIDQLNNLRCNGDFGGSININVKGGVVPYSYNWNNDAITQDIAGIGAGAYSVEVLDKNGCATSAEMTVTEPELLSAQLVSSKNVTHHGGDDGAIDIDVSGGTKPYEFKWSNEKTSEDISNLKAGSYTMRVTDATGCAKIMNLAITEPASLIAKVDNTVDVSCFGDSSGQANISVYGGVMPYSYSWSNGATTQDISSLPAGSYSVTITDANGFEQKLDVEITQPEEFKVKVLSTTNILCNDENTGAVDIDVEGGVEPYRYSWNNGHGTQDLDNLPAGEYSVKIVDANYCSVETSVTISEPEPLRLAFESFENVKCNGNSTGNIDISVSGGVVPYTYQWSNGATTQDLKGITAGLYSVEVTDKNGCVQVLEKEILEPTILTLTENLTTNASCNGSSTGAIKLNIRGGVKPYQYVWSSGDSTLNISNKKAGNYSLNVTDNNGCKTSFSKTITEPTQLVSSITKVTNNSCFNDSKGAVNITVKGGEEPYKYRWSNGVTAQDISDIKAGTYKVLISDANGCIDSLTSEVKENPILSAELATTNIKCHGLKSGAITLQVSGGVGPYVYKWSNNATTKNISGLSSGNYSVIVTDAVGCEKVLDAQITEPPRFVATLESEENLTCFGQNTGSIKIRVSGGVTPYAYKWSSGQTSQNVADLPIGEYKLTATDANGCVQTVETTLNQPPKINYAIKSVKDVQCYGEKQGAIDVSVSGGIGPFEYLWNNGAKTQDIQDLPVGNYAVKIRDKNNCENVLNAEIKQPERLGIKLDTIVNILCYGDNKGAVGISVSGGVKPYTYTWSNGATTQDISQLTSGMYTATVTDANGCSESVNAFVKEPFELVANISQVKNIACNGNEVGAISIDVKGGLIPYTFKWSNGSTTQNINNLSAGTYTVDIIDKNGCTQKLTATITQPPKLVSKLISAENVSCFDGKDGALNVSVTGGTAPFTYKWNNGSSKQDLASIPAGAYRLLITDKNGCKDSTIQASVTQPTLLEAKINNVTDIYRYGDKTGGIDISVSGGVQPYLYSWSNGTTAKNLSNVLGGDYSVQIMDKNGCKQSLSAKINQPPALEVKLASVVDVNCNSDRTGSLSIDVKGGLPPYKFVWNNGDSTQNISNVAAGDYAVTVIDASNYKVTLNANIAEPSPLILKTNQLENILCFGDKTGLINVTTTGGVTPYRYSWNSGQTTSDISNIGAGDYNLTVTDGAGCKKNLVQTIAQPDSFVVKLANVQDIKCYGSNSGEVLLDARGGVEPYSYSWNNGARTKDITEVMAGDYAVKISDANGCSTQLRAKIEEPQELIAAIGTVKDNSCFGDNGGSIDVNIKGGTLPYTYRWSNDSTSQDLSNIVSGEYLVTITDANGCSQELSTTIEEPTALEASVIEIKNVSCYSENTGEIQIDVSGGAKPYTYIWNNGTQKQDLFNATAGDYQLTISDANGCKNTLSATIEQPQPLVASIDNISHVLCYGESKGMIDAAVSGGTLPYTYAWSNGASSEDLTEVLAGSYSLKIKDDAGCTLSLPAVVNQPTELTLVGDSLTSISCAGQNTGNISVHAEGGVEPYNYTWNNGASGRSLSNVAAGEYSVIVTDANGCQATYTDVIDQPAELITTIDAITNIRCYGENTGSIYVTVRDGVAPYEFEWSNGAKTEDIRDLPAGNYKLKITQANGCVSVLEASIEEPTPFEASITSSSDIKCFGDMTGSVDIQAQGGEQPYRYAWSNGETTQNLAGIGANNYSVMVTDANGCLQTLSTEITEPNELQLRIDSVRNVKCCGDKSGAIFITALGGAKPYNYQWSNGATTQDIENLILGVYTVVVTDANGCEVETRDDMTLYEQVVSTGMFTTRDILFDVSKSTIKSESFITINRIASFMKAYPDLSFRIDGHTDSDGSQELNQKLSEDRAEAIKSALIKFGIRENRLETKGFGESQPIASNLTAKGKSFNRRVEFIALTGTAEGTLVESQIKNYLNNK